VTVGVSGWRAGREDYHTPAATVFSIAVRIPMWSPLVRQLQLIHVAPGGIGGRPCPRT